MPNAIQYLVTCLFVLTFYGNSQANEHPNKSRNTEKNIPQTQISGSVKDTLGNVLPGVSVFIKGRPNVGTTTDLNGLFALNIPSGSNAIIVRMTGYLQQEISLEGLKTIDVILREDSQGIDEVVVTAFGQRAKKSDLIGSVASLSPKDLRAPVSNLTTALQGKVAGVVSFQRSGEPGGDNADFFIRGVGTFGTNNKPLILVDNMEVTADDLARIPVDDIENFSILRDATASAVYGSRGANGVVLVTTKIGREGPASISFRTEHRVSTPTQSLKFADPVTWMKMYNEAVLTRNPLGSEPYSQLKIERTAAGDDPIAYPSVDWLGALTKTTTTTQNYNLSVAGGGQVATYNVSGNFTNDNGLLKMDALNNFNNNVNFKVMNLRSNIGVNITKSTFAMVRTVANIQNYTGPPTSGNEAYNLALRANPVLFLPVYQAGPSQSYIQHPLFGNSDQGQYVNPYAQIMRGYSERRRSNMQVQLELKQDFSEILLQGLNYRGLFNLSRNSYFAQSRQYNPFYYQPIGTDPINNSLLFKQINPDSGTEYLDFVPGERSQAAIFYMENQLSYQRTFNEKHNVFGMLINTIRDNVSTPVDNNISLINTLPNRNVSFSGSFTYGYDNRYHLQFAFGYNGSEKFSEKFRWGFFPSFGAAWNVSNEAFFEPLKSTINNFKIRFTRGTLGNDQILDTRFFYLSDVNLNSPTYGYPFGLPAEAGRRSINGVVVNRYANPDIRWEISKQTNLGIDLSLLDGTINFTGDFYQQSRDNIVQTRSLSSINGLTASVYANVGKYKSRGFDGELVYNKTVNSNLWFQGRGTFTLASGEYEFYEEPFYKNEYRRRKGTSVNHQFGYIAERLFIDDNEVYNSPAQEFGSTVMGGDIKYLDVNRDGLINDDDRMPIGHPTTPEVNYGFGLSTGYKGLDFSFFFSGVGRTSLFINPTTANTPTSKGIAPFGSETAPNAVFQGWADDYWSEENKNIYAIWPRLSVSPQANNTVQSTYWMRNGSLIRLKQVELGYTINKQFSQRYKIKNLRVYASANNLLRFSSFKLWDPEMGGNALNYPLQRVFNIGINANL
ncbi:TonB-dependent receptor [Sphingobacterium psychroaquaticum]|uniref:SusC/RagA family TonB-linked outer membrane protein n=1 Tax=Sphingobacterium psychroaquaticum TaxID=561061 RepID=UPI00106DCE28|nr:TonB-dependent receptor [Sphingobacterium psychroaquaticum]QBQ40537.1 TonB-dependent receptor [Sphingobacterium psychroaquaticum]